MLFKNILEGKLQLVPYGRSIQQISIEPTDKLQNQSSTSSIEPIDQKSQLLYHPYLTSRGLVFNQLLGLLICLDCSIAIGSQGVVEHFTHVHSRAGGQLDHTKLQATFHILGVKESAEEVALPNPCPQIEESIRKHHSMHHKDVASPKTWKNIPAQQLHHNQNSSYFSIIPTVAASSNTPPSIHEHFTNINIMRIAAIEAINASNIDLRQVSPWLSATQWHKYVAPYNCEHLTTLVKCPSQQDPLLGFLSMAVDNYTSKADQAINTLSLLALQVLNSPVNSGVYNNTPFHHHQDEATLHGYSLELVKLLALLLRPSTEYTISLPQALQANLQVLSNLLINKDLTSSEKTIHKICLQLWSSEWDEDAAQTMADPTICYLALSQLNPSGGFKEPKLTTPVIAKLEYLIRLTYVYEIAHIQATTQPPLSAFHLAKKYSKWYTEYTPSTFHSLRSLNHLASSISYSTMSIPKIWWKDTQDYRTMLYEGHQVKLDNISNLLAAMETKITMLWETKLLLGFKLRVDYTHLVDNLSNTEVGYSLFSDPRNTCFKGMSTLLLDTIMQDPIQSCHFFKGYTHDGQPIWNPLAFRVWLMFYSKMESLVLTKSEMTAGSSSRGTEINCLNLKNTRTRPSRGLFMMGDHLAYLCQYHKGSSQTLKDKVIPHAFDAHTSDMIIQNLAIARPFAQFAAYICFPNHPEVHQLYDSQLFVNFGKPFNTRNITTCLEEHTLEHIGRKLGLQDWRHISIGFRRKLSTTMEELIDQDNRDTIGALQSHHSRSTENRIYAISPVALASGNADDIFPLYLSHSTDWQEVLHVYRGGSLLPYTQCLAKDLPPPSSKAASSVAPLVKEIVDLLIPTLKPMIESIVKDALMQLQVTSTSSNQPADILLDKKVAQQIHHEMTEIFPTTQIIDTTEPQLFADTSASTIVETNASSGLFEYEDIGFQNIRSSSSTKLTDTTIKALSTWTEDQALNALHQVLKNKDATWTSNVQRDSIMAILNSTTDILTIATTGSGKSMLPIIPSLLETNAITIVILPLKSLITDYKRKLTEMDIPFLHYNGNHIPRGFCTPNMVIISVDMAREQHWEQWITEVNTIKPIRRFCFDEGQYPLTDSNFRESLRDIFAIRCLPVQLVVFSGTLSPLCEPKIKELFLLGEDTQVFRSISTNRPELQLVKALPQPRKDLQNIVAELWGLHSSLFSSQDRALVFVPWIDLGKEIAAKLGCEFYNSKDSDHIKEAIYNRWRSNGNCKVMVSTSAFSCGNDYSSVRLVIHAGTPRQMMGYIQEISRGGRDHKATQCYLLPTTAWGSASSTELDDYLGVVEMKDMCFGGTTCLRFAITQYNDGQGIRCAASSDNLQCSICLPNIGLMPKLFVPPTTNPLKRKAVNHSILDNPPTKKMCYTPTASSSSNIIPEPPKTSAEKTYALIQQRKQAKQKEEMEVMRKLETPLDLLFDQCVICHWLKKKTGARISEEAHEFKHCKFLESPNGMGYLQFKESIQYSGKIHSKICYICHVPNFGDRLHGPFTGPSGCQYLDVILPTLFFAFYHYKLHLEQEFNVQWPTLASYSTWLCGKLVKPKEKSNLISILTRIIQEMDYYILSIHKFKQTYESVVLEDRIITIICYFGIISIFVLEDKIGRIAGILE
ncbi:hypothetical protein BDN70DRAFT_901974 [Pholiota conissans]|uniref:DNA 3'-5' helicase n=1 Tax=Pholiota conissans TaxID=109636 RepID=A0A9P5YN25_9AGAR|nr:hypothetical protein BDN70DRAFT_901974 [Pholiota conissans]